VLVATPEHSEWNGLPVNIAAGLEAGLIERVGPSLEHHGGAMSCHGLTRLNELTVSTHLVMNDMSTGPTSLSPYLLAVQKGLRGLMRQRRQVFV
jgi:hypothetical protein